MRKLIYPQLVTLDGYVGGPAGELDWHVTAPDMHAVFNALQRTYGGYAMGRKTYEVMRGWDELGRKPGDAAEYRDFHDGWVALPKLVVSSAPMPASPTAIPSRRWKTSRPARASRSQLPEPCLPRRSRPPGSSTNTSSSCTPSCVVAVRDCFPTASDGRG